MGRSDDARFNQDYDTHTLVHTHCSSCKKKISRVFKNDSLRKDGKPSNSVYCRKCKTLRDRQYRGATIKSGTELHQHIMNSRVTIISKAECKRLSKIYTPPRLREKNISEQYFRQGAK
jgi:hypothetical protein